MATITGTVIITNYGEQQLLSSTFDVTKIKLGSGIWSPTVTSTALLTQEADLAASGAVVAEGASGFRLHITGLDSSANAYVVHEFALTDDTDTALAIYSQAGAIAAKGAGSSYTPAFDLVIESADPGSITVTGPTTYDLPIASPAIKGIIEIATQAEANALSDTTRAITPATLPIAQFTQRGGIEIATQAEVDAGVNTVKAVTASGVANHPLVAKAMFRVTTNPGTGVPTVTAAVGPDPDGSHLQLGISGVSGGLVRVAWAAPTWGTIHHVSITPVYQAIDDVRCNPMIQGFGATSQMEFIALDANTGAILNFDTVAATEFMIAIFGELV